MTVGQTDLCHVLPLEVVGWFLRRLNIVDGRWVLIVSSDINCTLASHINMRASQALNVVVGLTALQNSPVFVPHCLAYPVMSCVGLHALDAW